MVIMMDGNQTPRGGADGKPPEPKIEIIDIVSVGTAPDEPETEREHEHKVKTAAKKRSGPESKPFMRFISSSGAVSDAFACVCALLLLYFLSMPSVRFSYTEFIEAYVYPAMKLVASVVAVILWLSCSLRNGVRRKWGFLVFTAAFYLPALYFVNYAADGEIVVETLAEQLAAVFALYASDIVNGGFAGLLDAAGSLGVSAYAALLISFAVCAAVFIASAVLVKTEKTPRSENAAQ